MPFNAPAHGVLPAIRLDHLKRMTDDTGLLQHAYYTTPDPRHGYATDDNARALLAAIQCHRITAGDDALDLANRYLSFLRYAQRSDGRFHNFLAYDRTWLDDIGSDDAQGRAVWSLGFTLANAPTAALRGAAAGLLGQSLPQARAIRSPRGQAYCLIGFGWAAAAGFETGLLLDLTRHFAANLVRLWRMTAGEDWQWFEDILTYCCPKLCEGLLHAHVLTQDQTYADIALKGLDFLLGVYFLGEMLDLVGQDGWYRRGHARAIYDQQPIDACTVVHGCLAAHQVTGEQRYLDRAHDAFAWFLGRNRLNASLYDEKSGGCFDGLHPDRVNSNQGAESTLAYLLARLALESLALPQHHTASLTVPASI